MYKTKVQQLCHANKWKLPVYQTVKDGPNHHPRFISTVTVNGVLFHSPQPTSTAKKSQNDAAKLAFFHFSPNPDPTLNQNSNPNPNPNLHLQPSLSHGSFDSCDVDSIVLQPTQSSQNNSIVTSTITAVDRKNILHLYKNQLQNYAQKRNLNLPVYASAWEGPPHAMRFKCKVTIDGQTFESPKLFSALKDAENAAAEVALMSLSPGGVQEEQIGLYKNLLQELVQRKGFRLPSYSTKKYGEAHMPMFVSQVVIQGETFTGQAARSKKQAEISAAKVAYMTLNDRKGVSAYQGQATVLSTISSKANVITGLQHHANLQSPVSLGLVVIQGQPDKNIGVSAHQGQAPVSSTQCSEAKVKTGLQHHANLPSHISSGLVTQDLLTKI